MTINTKTLYVSDLDGTLLGADSRLSAGSARLLNHLITEHGALFTVATARTPATVVPLMQQVEATLPFIVIGGAALWNVQRNAYEQARPIKPDTVLTIADAFERNSLHPFIYRQHGSLLHTHHFGPMSDQESRFVAQRQNLPLKRFFLDDAHYRTSPDPALLIFSMNKYRVLKGIVDEVMPQVQCEVMLYHDIFDPDDGYLEICAPGTTKALAIKRLAKRLGVERVVVFGDNRNDIAMMRAATWSVAVDNAFDEVKAAAHEITGPNTADAVPHWILNDLLQR